MAAKRKRARYLLKYRVTYPGNAEGLRRWWAEHHVQEEKLIVRGTTYDDAWETLVLMHDQWERALPQIERLSAARRRRSRVRHVR